MDKQNWPKDRNKRLTLIASEVRMLWLAGMDVSSTVMKKSKAYGKLVHAANDADIS